MNAMVNGNGSRTEESQALVVNKDPSFRMAMEPNTLEALYKMATTLAKVNLCGVTTPEEALARLLCGRELGLTMMQSMRGVHVIEGRPSLSAALKEAVCLAHPEVCEEFKLVHSDNERATYRVKRRGREAKEYSFSMEDAAKALLLNRGKDPAQSNWSKYPNRMLIARAKGFAADTEFGDLLFGFATQEEIEDERITARQVIPQAPSSDTKVVDVVLQPTNSTPAASPPAAAATAPAPASSPKVAAAPRDFDAELDALKETIADAKTKEQRADVRKKVKAFSDDAGGAWADEAKRFYNLVCGGGAEAAAAAIGTTGNLPVGG